MEPVRFAWGTALSAMFWVYILQKPAGQFYIGHTDDVAARLRSHNRTDKLHGEFTRKNGPWELVSTEERACRCAAMTRERQTKSWASSRLYPRRGA